MPSAELSNTAVREHTNAANPPGAHHNKTAARARAIRERLPDERRSVTHRFNIGGYKGYLIVGMYPDGEPGELFITMAKEGSTVSGLVSSCAQAVSVALQHGVPLEVFCEKFAYTRFEPCGFTGNPDIPTATSVMDYVFRWLRARFVDKSTRPLTASSTAPPRFPDVAAGRELSAAPLCRHCGSLTQPNGACFSCPNCGASTGCG